MSDPKTALPDLFTAVDNKEKIYSKNITSRRIIPNIGTLFKASKAKRSKAAKKVLPKHVNGNDVDQRINYE